MRTKKIILQTRSSGQKCSFSKATFQNRMSTELKTELLAVCCQCCSHGSQLSAALSAMLNGPDLRREHVQEAGAGDRAQSNRKSMWNWTVLKPNYFTHIFLLSCMYIVHRYLKIESRLMALDKKKSVMVVVKFFKWVKNTSVILMLNAKHCDKIVTSSLLILAAHTEWAL